MKLKRECAGLYVTEDGRYEINLGEIFEYCDAPHPMGRNGGYCEGAEEHGKDSWGVWDREKDDYVDDGAIHFDTKKEAVKYLEDYLNENNL